MRTKGNLTPTEEDLLRTQFVDLSAIHIEYLKYAPAYAIKEAQEAIARVSELQSQGVLRTGIYYLVLVDLVGSTEFTATHGNKAAADRIRLFVTSSFNGLNNASLKNIGLFVKEIGDAVLFVFSHFTDVLSWLHYFRAFLKIFSQSSKEPYVVRTCIHLGEVSLDGVNPLSLGVSQTFKMEKAVKGGDVVLTYPAYVVAWPSLARATRAFRKYGTVELDGFPNPVDLYELKLFDDNDLERMVLESRK
jgi:class 3 adenylate cyclase